MGRGAMALPLEDYQVLTLPDDAGRDQFVLANAGRQGGATEQSHLHIRQNRTHWPLP